MRLDRASILSLARKSARPFGWTLAVASVVQPMATWLALFDWHADLIAHFREPALVVSLLAAMLMNRIHRPIAIGLGALVAWQAWGLSLCWWPNPVPPDPKSSARLRALVANVFVDNEDSDALIRLIRREQPDVVGLIEVSNRWITSLEPVRAEFAYRYEYPFDDDGRGLALWLRRAPISVEFVPSLTPGGIPAVHAVIDFAGKPRDLWLIHFLSPLERPAEVPLGSEFAALARRVERDGGSTIVVGDFNSTDGSPHFGRFLEVSKLRDSRLGFGRLASWPTWSPYRIGIDHGFLSADLAVKSRRLGPRIGSDHFPMLLELATASTLETKVSAQPSQSSMLIDSSAANLARSACLRKATSRSTSSGSRRSSRIDSTAISSVVFDPQPEPNAPIRAPRTNSEEAINR
jgi:endonuclease/exonuclease/phosphatase (EEP) superfamily protein YafD